MRDFKGKYAHTSMADCSSEWSNCRGGEMEDTLRRRIRWRVINQADTCQGPTATVKRETQKTMKYSVLRRISHCIGALRTINALIHHGQGWNLTTDTRIFSPSSKTLQSINPDGFLGFGVWNILLAPPARSLHKPDAMSLFIFKPSRRVAAYGVTRTGSWEI